MNQHANIDRTIWTLITGGTDIVASYRRHIEPEQFQVSEQRAVVFWTLEHFDNHGRPPGIDEVTHRVDALSGDAKDEKAKKRAGRVEDYVRYLIENYQDRPLDTDRSQSVVVETLNQLRVEDLQRKVEDMESRGNFTGAARIIESFERTPSVSRPFINLNGAAGYKFERTPDSMFDFGGDLGRFFGNVIQRKRLLALMGPEKRGKSYWLLEFAYQAFLSGHRVAIFSVGDMDEQDIRERWASRLTGRPEVDDRVAIPGGVNIIGEEPRQEAEATAVANRRMKAWTPGEVAREQKRIEKAHGVKHPRDTLVRVYEHPMLSITADEIAAEMKAASYTGWDVDVIVIDYADILAAPSGVREERDQINRTWMDLRKMSQELNACVISATQTDAESYTTHTMSMKNFSNDKRKLAHAFAMIGLNQTEREKEQDVMRLNYVVRRKGKFTESQCVHVAACRSIANIAMHSQL